MKVLNLDALKKETRSITLKSVDYPVVEMTVDNFIATTEAAEEMAAKKSPTIREQVDATIAAILRSVPTIPVSELRTLDIEQLGLISKFLRGDLDDEVKKAAEEMQGDEKNEQVP